MIDDAGRGRARAGTGGRGARRGAARCLCSDDGMVSPHCFASMFGSCTGLAWLALHSQLLSLSLCLFLSSSSPVACFGRRPVMSGQ